MNRSVITGMIAASAVCAGPGLVTPPQALADSVDTVGATAKGDSDDGTVRRPGRSRAAKPAPANHGDRPDKPCAWSVIWPVAPVRVPPRDSDIGVLPAGIVPAVPLPGEAGAAPFEVPDRDTDDPVPAPPAPLAVAPLRPAPLAVAPFRPAAPAVTPAPPPVVTPPTAPPSAAPAAPPTLSPADPPWSGYSEAVRVADSARIVASALPGLAALAGITALGGLLGYRQARAGYLLRAAGAGRFLQ